MFQAIKNLLGIGPKVNLADWISEGATIIDVRSRAEYSSGHVKGSLNIPLDQLSSNLGRLKKKDQPIITCCASGMRSGSAKSFLKSQGYTRVHNGGPWQNVAHYKKG
ncbi:MAG: rhodanese-like domain-containing protein [Bacteroidota bacterium]|jgi:phage shock protein E